MRRAAPGRAPYLAPLAFAASVLLSVALVLAIAFGPQTAKRVDDAPRVVRVAYSSGDPQAGARAPQGVARRYRRAAPRGAQPRSG